MFMLDANVLMHVANGSDGAARILERINAVGIAACCLSSITAWELSYKQHSGVGKVKKSAIQGLASALADFHIIDFTKIDAVNGGAIQAYMTSIGKPMGERDAMIVGHAMARGYTMVSDDRHFSLVPGLKLENWRS
jgi:tRNA(fMet)-specific endonuclease VapC